MCGSVLLSLRRVTQQQLILITSFCETHNTDCLWKLLIIPPVSKNNYYFVQMNVQWIMPCISSGSIQLWQIGIQFCCQYRTVIQDCWLEKPVGRFHTDWNHYSLIMINDKNNINAGNMTWILLCFLIFLCMTSQWYKVSPPASLWVRRYFQMCTIWLFFIQTILVCFHTIRHVYAPIFMYMYTKWDIAFFIASFDILKLFVYLKAMIGLRRLAMTSYEAYWGSLGLIGWRQHCLCSISGKWCCVRLMYILYTVCVCMRAAKICHCPQKVCWNLQLFSLNL
jgi:hypothetical protein